MRWWALGMLLVSACATEPPAEDDCRCFFATQRVSVRCGTSVCVSGTRLSCSTTEVSEESGACSFDAGTPGTRDAGLPDGGARDAGSGSMDASVTMPVDAGVDVPTEPVCQPTRDGCTCPLRYSSMITIYVPCCASICFASQNGAGSRCSASGTLERISSCE